MQSNSHHRGPVASAASSGSFFSRNFTKRETGRPGDSIEYPKGSIGLITLHNPGEDAVADLIFVHGLNGGSESTWTKNGNPSLFWPSAWLPNDEAFRDVRIHTFGYASGLSRESVLHVPDFARSLLASIHDSPTISSKDHVPMILLGHSMGGLVVKKAYILGHQTKEFEDVARNIFAIFFLATPHQGAGIADTLGRLLALAPGSRPFVQDLSPESPVLQSINEDFPLYSNDLKLFSFYENEPTKIGIGTQLIVEKHCAVMNYPNERKNYLNANHRNVAKFSVQTDPSYLAIRNAAEVISEAIELEDTNRDISQYLRSYEDHLPAASSKERKAMSMKILRNANGCFLWVTLVVKELRQVHTSTEIRKALLSNTADMDELYGRILNDMANARFGKDLAKAILTWTTFSFRFLSTDELHCAIELDLNDAIDDIERSISTCCGNLVYVDRSKKVQLLHLTVRDFLTRQGMRSEFQIDRADAHRRLALVCLRYLTRSPFMGSESVLKWIEHLARKGELDKVFQAGKTINNLLGRLAQHSPLVELRKELTLLHSWGNDLIHLVTKFGKELSFSPSSIHRLIPPFCPIDSAPSRQFSSPHRGLSVFGRSSEGWQDCLSILNYTKPDRPLTVAISQKFFGMGFFTGKVIVYDDVTCQEQNTLLHGEPVRALSFSQYGSSCASAGAKYIRVWDLTNWTEVHNFRIPVMCLALTFGEEDLLLFAATKSNGLMCWNLANGGAPENLTNWTIDFDDQSGLQSRQPTLAAFCQQQNLLAVVYRGEDLLLWDYERERMHDIYEKETGSNLHGPLKISDGSTTVWSLQFSTLGDDTLLAAAYSDGDLVIYDTIHGTVRDILVGVNAQKLSCSSDDRTLACVDSLGTIQLYDLETGKLLYRLEFEGDAIAPRTLAFTSDNHRLIDIRANQCRLWDPAVLLRQDLDDEDSDTVSVSTVPREVSFRGSMSIHITAIECIMSEFFVFCGKEDGLVHIYDISREPQGTQLFIQTTGVPIMLLHFNVESTMLACSDAGSRVTIRHVKRNGRKNWATAEPLVDLVVGQGVTGLLSSAKFSRYLAATDEKTYLWSRSPDSDDILLQRIKLESKGQWVQHGISTELLLWVSATSAKIYLWSTFEVLHMVSFANMVEPFMAIDHIRPLRHPRYFAAVLIDPTRTQSSQNTISIYDFSDFNTHAQEVGCIQNLGTLSSAVNVIIGIDNDRLVFLDTNNWVRSLPIGTANATAVRHFFIPSDWVSLVRDLVLKLGHSGEIIFVKRAELFVIKRGLDMTDEGIITPRKMRMSPRSAMFGTLPYHASSY
ncbi:NACHT and WD domain protein [Pyrenophora tritici-repentis]|nr:NACHT and WD domain protein [Pyrenophora tritici-repentis]